MVEHPTAVSAVDDIAHLNPVLFQKKTIVVLTQGSGTDTDYWYIHYATSTDFKW